MKDDSKPAFPVSVELGDGSYFQHKGMSIRDYFASAALQGYLTRGFPGEMTYADHAASAYKQADAMLREREK